MPSVDLADPTAEPIDFRRRVVQNVQSFIQKLLTMAGKGATKAASTRSAETTTVKRVAGGGAGKREERNNSNSAATAAKRPKAALTAPTVSSSAKDVSNNNNNNKPLTRAAAAAAAKALEEKLKLEGGATKGSVDSKAKASGGAAKVAVKNQKEVPPMAKKQPVPKNATPKEKPEAASKAQAQTQSQPTGEKLKLGPQKTSPKAKATKQNAEEQQGSKGSPRKQQQRKKAANPSLSQSKEAVDQGMTYYLKCDEALYADLVGGDEGDNDWKLGENCMICETDLAYAPVPPETESGAVNFPEAAVLGCGHVFHSLCLDMASDGQGGEPDCFICASLS
ncbi:unnamed protein product [Linum trigynum]|uniref:RING-type domain-containing protein n=1 Tax=Linum trigynum TaxID=586398 RepID=A0AAV2CQ14_9ROSI